MDFSPNLVKLDQVLSSCKYQKKNEGIERVKLFYDPKNAVYAIVFVMLFNNIDLQYIYD